MSDPHRQITFKPDFPIAQLRPGHQHPLFPANPRKGGHDVSLKELAHSIYEQGILQPLRGFLVEDGSGDVWVHVGERRLLASQQNLADHPDAAKTVPLLLIEGIGPQEAFQESLTEQLNRLPLHPIDQFEAFAELMRGGMTEAQIAGHYCIDKRVVQQRTALGKIAPDILKAWRGGAIDEACAREFTRLVNHKDQMKLFDRQRKSHGLTAQAVRSVLVPDHGDGAKLVNFVGLDVYRSRGGEIREDLFNGIHGVSDVALAAAMAKEKLDAECLRLTAMEGWSWAKPIDDMPAAWRAYDRSVPKAELTPAEKKWIADLQKIQDDEAVDYDDRLCAETQIDSIEAAARLRAFTSRQKAKSGCVLSVDAEGKLAIDAGVILPAQDEVESEIADSGKSKGKAAAAGKADTKPEPDPEPRLSNSQASDLAVILTEAAALVVKGNFRLSMAIALAAFASNGDGYPARLYHRGLGSNSLKLTGSNNFAKNLAAFAKMKPQQLEGLFAQVVAASLQFGAQTADRHAMTDADTAALVNAVDPKVMQAAILKRFDPTSYFERAPKAFALAAVEDVFGKGTDKVDASAPKSEAAAFAIENCPPSKWLPIELRPAGYSGPGAKKAAAKKSAAKKTKGRK
jgi:ParB family chromosome partitioning protein